jgi:hypothetical protein
MDRRSIFFLCAAVICALLVPVADPNERWLPVVLSIVYALLSLASWADARTRARE